MIKYELKDKDIDTTIPFRIEQIICDMWCGVWFVNEKDECIVTEPDYCKIEKIDGIFVMTKETMHDFCKKDSSYLGNLWDEEKIVPGNYYSYEQDVEGEKSYNFMFSDFCEYIDDDDLDISSTYKNHTAFFKWFYNSEDDKGFLAEFDNIKVIGETLKEAEKNFQNAIDSIE